MKSHAFWKESIMTSYSRMRSIPNYSLVTRLINRYNSETALFFKMMTKIMMNGFMVPSMLGRLFRDIFLKRSAATVAKNLNIFNLVRC